MSVEILHEKRSMTAVVSGEIDHHAAADIRITIDGELERATPEVLTFDMSGVTFMDSSGVGLVLGRARAMGQWGGKVRIKDPSARAEKILKMSGLGPLITPKPTGKEHKK